MPISIVKQYSVFLANKPGALKHFADLFMKENINILAIAEDVRFDAAVIRIAVEDEQEIGHMLTQHGFTNVKTDAIRIDTPDRAGIIRDIGDVMEKKNINITSVYGSGATAGRTTLIVVVNNITRAMSALEASGLF